MKNDIFILYILFSILYGIVKGIEIHMDKSVEVNFIDIILLPSIPISILTVIFIKLIER